MNSIYSICCPCSFPFITYVFLLSSLKNPKRYPSSIPTPSVWVRHGSVIPSPPARSCFLAVPKLELEARHPPQNGDLRVVTETTWSRRSFTTPCLVMDPPSLPPTTLVASWSTKLLPFTLRRPKLSTAQWPCEFVVLEAKALYSQASRQTATSQV